MTLQNSAQRLAAHRMSSGKTSVHAVHFLGHAGRQWSQPSSPSQKRNNSLVLYNALLTSLPIGQKASLVKIAIPS